MSFLSLGNARRSSLDAKVGSSQVFLSDTLLLNLPESEIRLDSGDLILKIPSVQLRRGDLFLLTGPNMSGKSSFLRLLARQRTVLAASIAERLRPISTILSAADDPMFPDWSVRDNVCVVSPCLMTRQMKKQLADFLVRVNSACGWSLAASDSLRSCSTGARSFVQLARAAVARPSLYLLDEITSNLDAEKLAIFVRELERLCADGVTIVVVSHSERDQRAILKASSAARTMVIEPDGEGYRLSC